MSLPWRTFTQSTTTLNFLVANKATTTECGTAYNLAYREIMLSHEWQCRNTSALVSTVDPYAVGTATATQGSTTVTGVTTVWTAAMVGRYIRISTDGQFYKITGFGGVGSLTIETAYVPATQTAVAYEIFQYIYPLPTDCDFPQAYVAGNTNPLAHVDVNWVTLRDPNRVQTSSTPVAWVLHGADATNTTPSIEFWPRFPSAAAVRLEYMKAVDDLSGTGLPIVRADLVEFRAMHYVCMMLYAKLGDTHWQAEATTYDRIYEKVLDGAKQEDLVRFGPPPSVQFERPITMGAQYVATHDIDPN